MQAYGERFARIYNLRWGGFANEVAPRLRDFYAHTAAGQTGAAVLDLCCGTGQLARHFLFQPRHCGRGSIDYGSKPDINA